MGRLFWKFFFFIWLAQLAAIFAIGASFWFKSNSHASGRSGVENSPPASMLIESAELTAKHGGLAALREMMGNMTRHKVYAVDESGMDILGRTVDSSVVVEASNLLDQDGNSQSRGRFPPSVRRIIANDGHTYLLFIPANMNQPRFGPPHPEGRPPHGDPFMIPVFPSVATLLASLIAAVLLARHFSKPIRNLRTAFEAATSGNLQMRLMPKMGGRRDELADLGRDFDRMTDKLRSLMESQQRLLHDVSHELRSPLARLQMAVGLVRQQPEKMDAWVERIERESIRIDQLVGELLTISRLEAGQTGSMVDRINMGDLVANIVEDAQFESSAQRKGIALSWDGDAIIKGQAELLHRAIENVIRNAIRHTPAGTQVDVQGSLKPGSRHLHLIICDQGSGVPAEELDSIFDPFFRGSHSRKETDGHGLGLAIAKRVVNAHRGSISAFNSEDKGLCVQIVLPVDGIEPKAAFQSKE